MSDDIPVDLCHEKMNANFRLPPAEVWTDIFKLLPRRTLVKQIQPVIHWFKEICDKNVKCVHLITEADQFTDRLEKDDPEAKKQVKDLAGNKCKLADHFRLELWLNKITFSYKSKAILRHCSDLFDGCIISLNIRWINSLTITQSLDHLERTKPLAIHINQNVDQITTFWRHPTIRDCRWIYLDSCVPLSGANLARNCAAISDWLHRRPMEDCVEEGLAQQIRCIFFGLIDPVNFDGLLNLCLEAIQSSQGPADRRQFVLCFLCGPATDLLMNRFGRVENKKTGEVLQLERVTGHGQVRDHWRLRRCLANEVAVGMEEIYANLFKKADGETMEVAIK